MQPDHPPFDDPSTTRDKARLFVRELRENRDRPIPAGDFAAALDHIDALLGVGALTYEPDADDRAEQVRYAARAFADASRDLDDAIDRLAEYARTNVRR